MSEFYCVFSCVFLTIIFITHPGQSKMCPKHFMFKASSLTDTADGIPSLAHSECLTPQRQSNFSSQFTYPDIGTEESCLLQPCTKPKHAKTLTYWDGVCLIVCQQIGSGIFSTPALVNRNTGSVGMALLFWVISGCIAWSGACNFRSP